MKMLAGVCRTIESSRQLRTAICSTSRWQRRLFSIGLLARASPVSQASTCTRFRGIKLQQYSSSSRFTSLLDDDEGERKRRNRFFDNEDEDDGDDEEEYDDEDDDDEDDDDEDDDDSNEDYEDEDSVEWAEVFREELGDPTVDEDIEDEVIRLFLEDPVKWTSLNLARAFHIPKAQIEAIIYFKGTEELGMSLSELKQRVREAKEKATKETKMDGKNQINTESPEEAMKNQVLEEEEDDLEALLGVEHEEAFRNPDFFFLNDEFEGYPPLTRRLGKNTQSDQMYPKEATAMQHYAAKRKFSFQKSFKKTFETTPKWKIAVKDISKPKNPTYIREGDGSFRLASDTEVMTRSWVRRSAFFQGLED